MKVVVSSSKILFLVMFVFLVTSTGRLSDSILSGGLSLKVAIIYSVLFFIFIGRLTTGKIEIYPNTAPLKILFILFGISMFGISFIRDGLLNTYIYSIMLTYIAVVVLVQTLYKFSFIEALQLFFISMLILLSINILMHYLDGGSLKISFSFIKPKRLMGYMGGGLTGALAGLSSVLSFIYLIVFKGKSNWLAIILLIISWWILLLSDNRTSLTACAIIYLLIFLGLSNKGLQNKLIFILFTVLIIFFLIFI